MPRRLVILGAGGFAREVAWLLEGQIEAGDVELLGFAAKSEAAHIEAEINGYACRDLDWYVSRHDGFRCVIAIGSSEIRERLHAELCDDGATFHTCIAPDVRMSGTVEVGEGSVICAGSILTVNIVIGRSVHINLDCTVGHDAVIEDFVTIAPGAHISGNVTIKRGAYIGTGANIINGTPDRPLVIGEGAVVGSGACVTRDVPASTTVVGVPARPIGKRAGA